jgi:hypothetical protein
MSGYELAELNIVLMKAPLDSSAIAEFVANRIDQRYGRRIGRIRMA